MDVTKVMHIIQENLISPLKNDLMRKMAPFLSMHHTHFSHVSIRNKLGSSYPRSTSLSGKRWIVSNRSGEKLPFLNDIVT